MGYSAAGLEGGGVRRVGVILSQVVECMSLGNFDLVLFRHFKGFTPFLISMQYHDLAKHS